VPAGARRGPSLNSAIGVRKLTGGEVRSGTARQPRLGTAGSRTVVKTKRAATGILNLLEILSSVSNDGALMPRSTRLRKSTEISRASANCSCVILRCTRMSRSLSPNFFRSVATWKVFPGGSLP